MKGTQAQNENWGAKHDSVFICEMLEGTHSVYGCPRSWRNYPCWIAHHRNDPSPSLSVSPTLPACMLERLLIWSIKCTKGHLQQWILKTVPRHVHSSQEELAPTCSAWGMKLLSRKTSCRPREKTHWSFIPMYFVRVREVQPCQRVDWKLFLKSICFKNKIVLSSVILFLSKNVEHASDPGYFWHSQKIRWGKSGL